MTPDHAFCTIVTRSYLRGAAVLAESLERHHPGARLQTLVLDPANGAPAPGGAIVPHGLDALEVPGIEDMKRYYDAHALSNNLKPFFMRFLARAGFGKVVFLDSDILVTGSLSQALDLLDRHAFLLTPHLLDADRSHLGEVALDAMADYGAYNGGFIAARSDARGLRVLDWLCARLGRTALTFADQKILTLCAQLFAEDVLCLREPGWNVAYWNLHERTVTREAGRYLVGEDPLAFFHFSGYRFDKPAILYAQRRRGVAANPALQALLDAYGEAVARYAHLRHDGYGFARLDGRDLTPGQRAHYIRNGTFEGYGRDRLLRLTRRLLMIARRRS